MTGAAPVRERVVALDVVRGVAICGILFANVLNFFGIFLLSPERQAAFPTAGADSVAKFIEHALVSQKFYSIFSLLFGIGFGLQLARGDHTTVRRFKRRLKILLAIGAVHALLIWAGDILMLYALLGFTLPWFARKSDEQLLRWTWILLAIPTLLYLLVLAVYMVVARDAVVGGGGPPAAIMRIFENAGSGRIQDVYAYNLVLLLGRWADLIATVRFPKVLGMFVLGLWLARKGIALEPAKHRPLLARWAAFGLAAGLPLNFAAAWAMDRWEYLPPSPGGLLQTVLLAGGVPLLALGYAAAVALLVVDGRRIVALFAPVGRMALTNYLMHSVVCVILAFGFGLWWQIGAARAMGIAAVVVLLQIPLSAWWLSRHESGPVEKLWRRLTYKSA